MGGGAWPVESSVKMPHQPSPKSESKQELEQHRRRRRRRSCLACCGGCIALLVLLAVVILILALTLFKPKKPDLHVNRITVEDFAGRIILNIPPSVSLTITLGLDVSVRNPNKAAFNFHNSTASVFYRGIEVGLMPIPAGHLDAGGTTEFSSSLELRADRLLADSQVYVDFIAGSLPISAISHVSGRVNVLNVFKRHVDTTTVCNSTISPQNINKALDNLECSYDIDL